MAFPRKRAEATRGNGDRRDILGFMKKWSGGSLGTLGIPGTLWLLGFPSVPWGSSGPPRLAALRVRALGELHENCCERVPFG